MTFLQRPDSLSMAKFTDEDIRLARGAPLESRHVTGNIGNSSDSNRFKVYMRLVTGDMCDERQLAIERDSGTDGSQWCAARLTSSK